jgi:WD40 repeat protein
MSDVFISYAREDREFARRLVPALEQSGRTSWIDWEGIEPSDDWWRSVQEAIDGADAILFLASPDSLASEVCGREIGHGAERNKRLIALVCRDIEGLSVPEAIAGVNWISLRPEDDWDEGVARLERALALDLDLVRVHTKVLTRAEAWRLGGGRASPLLRGEELRSAEDWLARAAAGAQPQPTELQAEFVAASRRAATKRQRLAIGGALGVAALAIGLSIFAFVQRSDAQDQAEIAHARELAARADASLGTDPEASLAPAAQAVRARATPQTIHSLAKALTASRLRADFRGPSPVAAAAFSPDGSKLAFGDDDGAVRMVDVGRRRLLWRHPGPTGVASLGFSRAGDVLVVAHRPVLAVGAEHCSVEVLDARTGARLRRLGPVTSGFCDLWTAVDGPRRIVAILSGIGALRFWNVDTGRPIGDASQIVAAGAVPAGIAIDPDGRQLAVATSTEVQVFDLGTGRLTAKLEPSTGSGVAFNVTAVAFSPDGRELQVSGEYGAKVFFVDHTSSFDLYSQDGSTQSAAWSPDGRLLAAGAGFLGVDVWSSSSRLVEVLHGSSAQSFSSVAFSSTGLLAGGSRDGSVRIWAPDPDAPDLTRADGTTSEQAHGAAAAGLVAVGDGDSNVTVLDEHGRQLKRLAPGGERPFAVSADGLLAFTRPGTLYVWRLRSGTSVRSYPLPRHTTPAAISMSADGGTVAAITGVGKVMVLSEEGAHMTAVPVGANFSSSHALSMSPDGRLLAITLRDSVRILRTSDLETVREEPGIAAAFSSSGSLLAVQRPDLAVALLRTDGWKRQATATDEKGNIEGLAFSPDDRLLAATGSDGVLRVWDTRDGALIATRQLVESTLAAQRTGVPPVALTAAGIAFAGGSGYDVCDRCLDRNALLAKADARLAQIHPVEVR